MYKEHHALIPTVINYLIQVYLYEVYCLLYFTHLKVLLTTICNITTATFVAYVFTLMFIYCHQLLTNSYTGLSMKSAVAILQR